MPRFRYEAVTNTGTSVTNTEEADSRADLVAKLKVRGYWPTMIEQSEASTDDSKKNASSSPIDSNKGKLINLSTQSHIVLHIDTLKKEFKKNFNLI